MQGSRYGATVRMGFSQVPVLSRPKRHFSVTPEEFDRFLCWLDADRDQAGVQYEVIRHKLIDYFRWHKCAVPEEAADITIDRVVHRVAEGTEIYAAKPHSYFYGTASYVLRELAQLPRSEPLPDD